MCQVITLRYVFTPDKYYQTCILLFYKPILPYLLYKIHNLEVNHKYLPANIFPDYNYIHV